MIVGATEAAWLDPSVSVCILFDATHSASPDSRGASASGVSVAPAANLRF